MSTSDYITPSPYKYMYTCIIFTLYQPEIMLIFVNITNYKVIIFSLCTDVIAVPSAEYWLESKSIQTNRIFFYFSLPIFHTGVSRKHNRLFRRKQQKWARTVCYLDKRHQCNTYHVSSDRCLWWCYSQSFSEYSYPISQSRSMP